MSYHRNRTFGCKYIVILCVLLWDHFCHHSHTAIHTVAQNSDQGFEFQQGLGVDDFEDAENIERLSLTSNKVDPVHIFDPDTGLPSTKNLGDGPYLVRWQTSPVLRSGKINSELFHENVTSTIAKHAIQGQSVIMSDFVVAPPGPPSSKDALTSFFATLRSIKENKEVYYLGDPMAYLIIPVFDNFDVDKRQVVAVIKAVLHWKEYFRHILPSNVQGITVVLENKCSGFFTYEIQGTEVFGVGYGDHHDVQFTELGRHHTINLTSIQDGTDSRLEWDEDGCPYSIHVYPSTKYYSDFITGESLNVTFAVGMVFFYSILLFIFYDRLVESRQRLILAKATKSTAIVASLFPKNVRDRLLQVHDTDTKPTKSGVFSSVAPTQRLKSYLGGDQKDANEQNAQPIADLFPHCTVFFAGKYCVHGTSTLCLHIVFASPLLIYLRSLVCLN